MEASVWGPTAARVGCCCSSGGSRYTGDVSTLPDGHLYVGTFGAQRAAGTSAEGGTIIGIKYSLVDGILETEERVRCGGSTII